jgi:hypothetical protein
VDADPYSSGYDVDRSAADAPSALTGQLPTITEVVRDPGSLAAALAAGLVWTLVLVGTTATLNRSLKTRYDRIAVACRRLVDRPWPSRIAHLLGSGHVLVVVGMLMVNATVLAFVDPHLGLDATSLRLVGSIAIAQLVCGAVPFWIAAGTARRFWKVPARIRTLPLGLVIGLVGVTMSRFIGFVPGLLAGAVLGLAASRATTRHLTRLEQIEAGSSLVIAAIAWPLTSLIPTDQGALLVFAHDAAVAVTISAILGTLIDLLPFAGFPGALLKEQARWSWVTLTVVTWAAFVVFVVPQSRYWLDVGDGVSRWLGIAVIAGLAGLAVVLLLHRSEARRARAMADAVGA